MIDDKINIKKADSMFGNADAPGHVTGRSIYVDDIPAMQGMLYVRIFDSPLAHGTIRSIDYKAAEQTDGVVKIFSFKDIPGENLIGGIIPDEPLLADTEVHFCGQPILIIAAENEDAAEEALHKIKIDIGPLPVITDPRIAFTQNKLLSPSRKLLHDFKTGKIDFGLFEKMFIIEMSKNNNADNLCKQIAMEVKIVNHVTFI